MEYALFQRCGGIHTKGRAYSNAVYECVAFLEEFSDTVADLSNVQAMLDGHIWDVPQLACPTPPEDGKNNTTNNIGSTHPVAQALGQTRQKESETLHDLQVPRVHDQTREACPRCHKHQILVDSKQRRGLDEMPTLLYLCLDCGQRWTKNN